MIIVFQDNINLYLTFGDNLIRIYYDKNKMH